MNLAETMNALLFPVVLIMCGVILLLLLLKYFPNAIDFILDLIHR